MKTRKKITIALVCGGPSRERGISLNSARSVLDHLQSDTVDIVPFYFDQYKKPYKLSQAQMYSNTPSDFDFKLKHTAKPLDASSLVRELKKTDIVFPVMHGTFGEDGTFQKFLEKNDIPYIGSTSAACARAFDKFIAQKFMAENGLPTISSVLIKKGDAKSAHALRAFFKISNKKRFIVKPTQGGSSIGVMSVSTVEEACAAAQYIFKEKIDTRVIVEPFIEGREFTLTIIENRFGLPTALIPTEIEMTYEDHQVFDFRKKYLPTNAVTHHCPPRFGETLIRSIQAQAENIFALFEMRHFARFDGWVLDDGSVIFSDLNPFNGMEQNSFMFQQGARIGMTHTNLLQLVVRNACRDYGIPFPANSNARVKKTAKPVAVLFGGATSERQVSVMSGTNAWLKLRHSEQYDAEPYLLDLDERTVWPVPYDFALHHTVEEIRELLRGTQDIRERSAPLVENIRAKLAEANDSFNVDLYSPKAIPLDVFIGQSEFVFLALHGGLGEDGTLQKKFEEKNVLFNGAGSVSSRVCMDKWLTNQQIQRADILGVTAAAQSKITVATLMSSDAPMLWKKLVKDLNTDTLIVKPKGDGCSSGIVRLFTYKDLETYVSLVAARAPHIPQNTFKNQKAIIEMPNTVPTDLIFEPFIETDKLIVEKNKLKHLAVSGLVEVTVGVVEQSGRLHAFNPSITVAEGEVLSVEEKFQGGTGINITPPPAELIDPKIVSLIKKGIESAAEVLGIKGYARLDAFVNIHDGTVYIIEANTLPALTPSTVIYQQSLAEKESIHPLQFLEMLIKNKGY